MKDQKQKGKEESSYKREGFDGNVIKETRRIIRNMSQTQKFKKAKAHIMDALRYKHQRHESESLQTPLLFRVVYFMQLNSVWSWVLYLSGYMFMCLAAIDNQSYTIKIVLESIILLIFWLDLGMQFYLKKFDCLNQKSRYNDFFCFKAGIVILMTIDLIIFSTLPCYDCRPIRPFRIFRCFVPVLFDPQMRKILYAFASAYIDIIVYFIFFAILIISFAIIGNKILVIDPQYTDPLYPTAIDPYKNNYLALDKMIFITYVTASYDSFPDNQILALQNYQPNYLFFVLFIVLNFFLFSSIPGELIYDKFRQTRIKLLIADQIRQQHSLILAFVTLAEDESNLSIGKLIKFLLYMYKYKIRYIEYITDICLRLDNNNNRSIQVNEFMQLTKILLENEAMLPPNYDDIELWTRFRNYMNDSLKIKTVVKHWIFELTVSILFILSFINAIQLMYNYSHISYIFDGILIWLFFVQLMVRIIGIGPEDFFLDRWNNFDTFLIITGLVSFFVGNNSVSGLVKLGRIFRIGGLIKLISGRHYLKGEKFQIWVKVVDLFRIMIEILPIITRFMTLFVFFYYLFGVIGMQLFYDFYATQGSAHYNDYEQFSNFRNLVNAQYINIQILYEGGWSSVINNHVFRAPHYYAYIYMYFILMHIIYVYMIAYCIKGIFWEVYFTVHTILMERDALAIAELEREEQNLNKTKEIDQINQMIENHQFIEPNTLIKRELIENKFDQQIFVKLQRIYENEGIHKNPIQKSKLISQMFIDTWEIDLKDIKIKKSPSRYNRLSRKKTVLLNEVQQIDNEDFQVQLSQILQKCIIDPKIKYSEYSASPPAFVNFLKSKFKHPSQFYRENQFNLHLHPLNNSQSMEFHIYEMHAFLNIETSKRQQKAMIIKTLIDQQIITEEKGQTLIKKKLLDKKYQIDSNFALRKLFLADINESLISKFQIEYFSSIYGYSFKYINKLTLEPILRSQAKLTYTLRNILRYPQISNIDFFEMLTSIQDQISQKLLQSGSLFKFIYKLDCEGDIWFSIDYKRHQDMRIHFLKSGIWCYYEDMKEKHILYAKDIFDWKFPSNVELHVCEQYIKRFYQNFQTLAFGLSEQTHFFCSNPQFHIYDLYIQHFEVVKTKRFKKKKLQISKIMMVMLSKEEERADMGKRDLIYSLSDISLQTKKHKEIAINFDITEDAIFEKLKHLPVTDDSKIVQSEGLPFAYAVNLMKDISDTISLYSQNFIYQIEKAFNEKYQEYSQQGQGSDKNKKGLNCEPLHLII